MLVKFSCWVLVWRDGDRSSMSTCLLQYQPREMQCQLVLSKMVKLYKAVAGSTLRNTPVLVHMSMAGFDTHVGLPKKPTVECHDNNALQYCWMWITVTCCTCWWRHLPALRGARASRDVRVVSNASRWSCEGAKCGPGLPDLPLKLVMQHPSTKTCRNFFSQVVGGLVRRWPIKLKAGGPRRRVSPNKQAIAG